MSIDLRWRRSAYLFFWLTSLAACRPDITEAPKPQEASWAVTAWGEHFEVFPEVGSLVAGEPTTAHTHVTVLEGFEPLAEGRVEVVLVSGSGESVFEQGEPVSPGHFAVELTPPSTGEFDLYFRIHDAQGTEEVRGGRVRVGTLQQPGGITVAPAPRGGSDGGEPLDVLKEEQWRSDFATTWVRNGSLALSVEGWATVRPPAGGVALVTAPVDGVLRPASSRDERWPFVGLEVRRDEVLFRVVPRVAAGRSLASLEAELATLTADLNHARERHQRLQELLDLEATSRQELDESHLHMETLEARQDAASRDLEAARASRQGGSSGQGLRLIVPFDGQVAAMEGSPGSTVSAGQTLARVVRTDVVWLQIAMAPEDARRLATSGATGIVLRQLDGGTLRLEEGVRLVSVAPELEPETGTVTVLLETPSRPELLLGTTLETQVLLTGERRGVVIPASALVDDGGVSVVYLQLSGESFVRQTVEVLERQGEELLVEGLTPGQRLVSRGGEAIRRSSLMASGAGHGHVH